MISAEHQLYYEHGVQLAVLDVLYKHNVSQVTASTTAAVDSRNQDHDDSDGEHDDGEVEQALEVIEEDYDLLAELSDEYQSIANKVRKVAKMFKRSPTKNDSILQPYVKREFGKEMSLARQDGVA